MELYSAFIIAAAALCLGLMVQVALWLLKGQKSLDKSPLIPGYEMSHPSEGNAKQMAEAGSFVDFLLKSHEKFGDIFSFYMGTRKYISVASPELMKPMAAIFDRDAMLFDAFRPLFGDQSIQFVNGEEGRKRRQLQDKSYSHSAVMKGLDLYQKEAVSVVDKWSAVPCSEHIPISDTLYMFALKVQSIFSFSDFFDDEEKLKTFIRAYDVTMSICNELMVTGPMKEGTEQHTRFYTAKNTLYQIMKEIGQLRERTEVAPEDKTLLDSLLDNYDNEDMVFDDCITYLIGGSHTTSTFLSWCVYYFCLHPNTQTKIRKEINEHHKQGDPITHDVLRQMTYLHAVMDEVIRISRVAPYAARCADHAITLEGYKIPANTPVIQCFGAALHNERIFKNPKEFIPDRFMPEQKKKLPPFAYEPFGFAGKRKCPGYRLSLTEAQVFIISLLEKLELSLVPGQTVESDFGIVTRPKGEIWITVSQVE